MQVKRYKITPLEIDMLRESNAIEGVYDDKSLEQAIVAWEYLIRRKRMSIDTILRAHKILMLNQPLQPNEKGYLWRVPVWIGRQEAMLWENVPKRLKEWVQDANVKAFDFGEVKDSHIEFERIHPFVDGNGRIGRMLMNWRVVHQLQQPVVVLEEEHRQEYYEWFK